jgi:hypothetical protein
LLMGRLSYPYTLWLPHLSRLARLSMADMPLKVCIQRLTG